MENTENLNRNNESDTEREDRENRKHPVNEPGNQCPIESGEPDDIGETDRNNDFPRNRESSEDWGGRENNLRQEDVTTGTGRNPEPETDRGRMPGKEPDRQSPDQEQLGLDTDEFEEMGEGTNSENTDKSSPEFSDDEFPDHQTEAEDRTKGSDTDYFKDSASEYSDEDEDQL